MLGQMDRRAFAMTTKSTVSNKTNRKAVIRRVEHAVEGRGLGAVARALIGSMAGPPGAVAGAIIGGVAGTMTGAVLDREARRRTARTRELDAEIGGACDTFRTPFGLRLAETSASAAWEVSMSTALLQPADVEVAEALARLRRLAALVRALLDEFDRLTPLSTRTSEAAQCSALGEQLAEEVRRLGGRMLECSAAMTRPRHVAAPAQTGACVGQLRR